MDNLKTHKLLKNHIELLKIIGLQKILSEFCFCSPLSPQGMLIFGAISCAWKLKLS